MSYLKPDSANALDSRQNRRIDELLPSSCPHPAPADPDLTLIVEAWNTLPDSVRAEIRALVKAAPVR
jgi:hypothetical protein